jgi:hypothetical protein
MPTVAGRKFPYTAAGRSAAKRYAAKTGKRMTESKKKKKKRGAY